MACPEHTLTVSSLTAAHCMLCSQLDIFLILTHTKHKTLKTYFVVVPDTSEPLFANMTHTDSQTEKNTRKNTIDFLGRNSFSEPPFLKQIPDATQVMVVQC